MFGVLFDTLKTLQSLLRVPAFFISTSKLWSLFLNILRKPTKKNQMVQYDPLSLFPLFKYRPYAVKRKILVLDLDETLIHSYLDRVFKTIKMTLHSTRFYPKDRFFVYKRPHVDDFLEVVSQWYKLVVFTSSMEIYGSPVADRLDNNKGFLNRRYYRQHCTLNLGSYTKDLAVIHNDLSSIAIIDNSPVAYCNHPDNAIPIKPWFNDPGDTALLNLLPLLDALRFMDDVRSMLSRNHHKPQLW